MNLASVEFACALVFGGMPKSHTLDQMHVIHRILLTDFKLLHSSFKISPGIPYAPGYLDLDQTVNDENNSKKIIGIRGKKGSGKSTVADILNSNGFKELAFAEPLKDLCSWWFNIPLISFYEPMLKEVNVYEWNVSPRVIMQTVGTLFRENIEHVWILNMVKRIKNEKHNKLCISDIRHQDELDVLKKYNHVDVLVVRPGLISVDSHISETSLDQVAPDVTLVNDGDMSDLRNKAVLLLDL